MDFDSLEIEWAGNMGLRARKVVRRSNHRVTGKYPSWKMGRMMQWESTLERDAFYLLDADPSVTAFSEQPARIDYMLDGKTRTHFPDILVSRPQQSSLYEIKSDKEADSEEVQARANHLTLFLEANQLHYKVVTESEIRKEPRLSNAKLLLRHGRLAVTQHGQQRIIERYFSNEECSLRAIPQPDFAIACRMILEGTIWIDINKEITDSDLILQREINEAKAWL